MAELTEMTNIGKEMATKLKSVGIDTAESLAEIGAKQAFLRLKAVYPQVCLVHLYTLEGAIRDEKFDRLSEEVKADLKKFVDSIK